MRVIRDSHLFRRPADGGGIALRHDGAGRNEAKGVLDITSHDYGE